jgi:hypothetical protein
MFVIENENNYPTNKSVHKMNTRAQNRLHVSSARLSIIQKGVYFTSKKNFNNLPHKLYILKDNVNLFKRRLKFNYLESFLFYRRIYG